MKIHSEISSGIHLRPFSQEQVRVEPQLHKCDVAFAYRYGGPIVRTFLDGLPMRINNWDDGVVDTRVHMLMPGWYPCIPGWHHDDVPRSRSDGQPNYVNPEYKSEHAMALVGAPVSRTKFALGTCDLEIPALGRVIYEDWHTEVAKLVRSRKLQSYLIPMGQIVFFDWLSWHRGVAANGNGWRWFGRITRNTSRVDSVRNEIRAQTQVYMSATNAGW